MRKFILFLVIYICFFANAISQDSLKLDNQNPELLQYLHKYVGKSVEEFLIDFCKRGFFYQYYNYIEEPNTYLWGCSFYYGNGFTIMIYIKKFEYIKNIKNIDRNWDFNLFKKEKIWYFELMDGNKERENIFRTVPEGIKSWMELNDEEIQELFKKK
jgi:hypothetical protein